MQGGNRQPYIIIPGRIVGRRLNELGKREDYNKDIDIVQRFEINENDNYINTLTTVQKDNMLLENFRIRRLTPTECFRLQGFKDADIQKCINAGVSASQLYKQNGNSICVNVPKAILNKLLKEVNFEIYNSSI